METVSKSTTFLTESKSKSNKKQSNVRPATQPPARTVDLRRLSTDASAQLSQTALLHRKKCEMEEVQNQLERKRIEFQEKMLEADRIQETLAQRQTELKEKVSKFEKYIKESSAKAARANKKAQEEKEQTLEKQAEIAQLQATLQELINERKRIELALTRASRYEAYLVSVVEKLSTEGSEMAVEKVRERFVTLQGMIEQMRNRADRKKEKYAKQELEYARYITDTQNQIFMLNSELARMQKRLEKLRLESDRLELEVGKRDKRNRNVTTILGQVKMALTNLYTLCEPKGVMSPDAPLNLYVTIVGQKLMDLQDIVNQAKARAKLAEKPVK